MEVSGGRSGCAGGLRATKHDRLLVDRYIGDFEKLLADVARTDPNRTVTQSYLTSDTGKVYTMLAHAAGRLS